MPRDFTDTWNDADGIVYELKALTIILSSAFSEDRVTTPNLEFLQWTLILMGDMTDTLKEMLANMFDIVKASKAATSKA